MNCPQKNELSKYNKKMYFVENLFAFCYVLLRSFFICEKEHVYEKYRLHQLYVEQYTWNSYNLNIQCSLSKLQLKNLMDFYFETMLCRFLVRCTMWITWSEFDRFENNFDLNAKHCGVVTENCIELYQRRSSDESIFYWVRTKGGTDANLHTTLESVQG
jgi:hypothetical protein